MQPVGEGSEEVVGPKVRDCLPIVLSGAPSVRAVEPRRRLIRRIYIAASTYLDEREPGREIITAALLEFGEEVVCPIDLGFDLQGIAEARSQRLAVEGPDLGADGRFAANRRMAANAFVTPAAA
jgi:hypothetical protein